MKISFLRVLPAFVLLGLLSLTEPALATNIIDTGMSKIQIATQQFGERIFDIGVKLLFLLATVQISVNGILLLLKQAQMEEILASIVRFMISTGVFYSLMHFSSDYLPAIINSFDMIGQRGSGLGRLTPSILLFQGVDLGDVMVNAFNGATGANSGLLAALQNFVPAMTLTVIGVIMFISFVILAAQMALSMVSTYLWLCITPLLLGFGGSQYTKDIAMNALKGGIPIGMKYVVVYLIAGIAATLAPIMGESMKDVTLTDWSPMYWSLGLAMILAYLSFQLPKVAADLINGTASLSAGDAATNMAMLAAGGVGAVAGAAGLAGAAQATLGAGSHAVSTATSALGKALSGALNADFGSMRAAESAFGGSSGSTSAVSGSSLGMQASGIGSALNSSPTNMQQPTATTAPTNAERPSKGDTSRGFTSDSSGNPQTGQNSSRADTASAKVEGGTKAAASVAASNPLPTSGGYPGELGTPVAPTGDASTASISGPGQSSAADPYRRSLHDHVRELQGYVPNDAQTVGLSANLSSSVD